MAIYLPVKVTVNLRKTSNIVDELRRDKLYCTMVNQVFIYDVVNKVADEPVRHTRELKIEICTWYNCYTYALDLHYICICLVIHVKLISQNKQI